MLVSEIVEKTLSEKPETRSSDKRLFLEIGEHYGFILTIIQRQAFFDMPSFETMRRIRQKIQEQGRHLPTKEVMGHRRFKRWQVQQQIPKTNPNRIDNLLNTKPVDDPQGKLL